MSDFLKALEEGFSKEPYAQIFGIKIVELEPGRALVRMETTQKMNNIFEMTHGAAIYSLIDAAFELTVNSHGTVAVALSVNVSYINAAAPGEVLLAEGKEVNRSSRISTCEIRVTGEGGKMIAMCQTLAYRKKDPLPFL
jgi:acyl-CoA thioesterase